MTTFRPDPKPTYKSKGEKQEKTNRYTCKFCKEHYRMTAKDYALRQKTAAKRTCGEVDCMVKAGAKFLEEVRKTKKKEWNKRKKEGNEKLKTLTNWKDDLQKPINWIVKQLDKGEKCISHPKQKYFLRMDAGHYWSVGTCSDLRFNLHNIHGQSSSANQRHGGCPEYLLGLQQRYGSEYMEMVQGLKLKHKGIGKEKFTIDNIKNIYLPIARRIKREIEKGADFTRDQINEMIGIY